MTSIHAEIDTPEALAQERLDQERLDQKRLEQAWLEDKEHSHLDAELQRLEQRERALRSEMPGYDSHLRRDARFPDSAGEDAGDGTRNDRLSPNGDEPPVH